MSTPDSLRALRRANPRTSVDFAARIEAAAGAVRSGLAAADVAPPSARREGSFVQVSVAGVALAAAAAVAVSLTLGPSGSGTGVESAAAAVERAATATAASADRSGTAVVRMTRGGSLWAQATIRWNGSDLVVSQNAPMRPGAADSKLLLVDGMLFEPDPEGGWLEIGSPKSIDPDSGTTPREYLAAVREDVGGSTLRRIAAGATGLTARRLDDGSNVYSGTASAGLIARETSFKGGQSIRVLPFGYVAHDEAADPDAPLTVAFTVGVDGVLEEIAVRWGAGSSAWTYTVRYSKVGTTHAPTAPAHAKSLLETRQR